MKVQTLAKALGIRIERAAKWQPYIDETWIKFRIANINERASFLAQIGHESALLSRLEENLNYSAEGLAKTWPNRFMGANGSPNIKAIQLSRRPEQIANFVYSNRMGNGSEASGDGWKYRGRGPIQITGRNNYRLCGESLGVDLIAEPDMLILKPRIAMLSAGWFWVAYGLDQYDDDTDVTRETRIINGGKNGLAHRQALFNQALDALKKE